MIINDLQYRAAEMCDIFSRQVDAQEYPVIIYTLNPARVHDETEEYTAYALAADSSKANLLLHCYPGGSIGGIPTEQFDSLKGLMKDTGIQYSLAEQLESVLYTYNLSNGIKFTGKVKAYRLETEYGTYYGFPGKKGEF